jgi:hypothetical protein
VVGEPTRAIAELKAMNPVAKWSQNPKTSQPLIFCAEFFSGWDPFGICFYMRNKSDGAKARLGPSDFLITINHARCLIKIFSKNAYLCVLSCPQGEGFLPGIPHTIYKIRESANLPVPVHFTFR